MGRLARAMVAYPTRRQIEEKRERRQRHEDERARQRELELLEEQNALLALLASRLHE